MRRLSKDDEETFPVWQGMQYFASMFSGEAKLHHVDNLRYGHQEWTTVRDVLSAHLATSRPGLSMTEPPAPRPTAPRQH